MKTKFALKNVTIIIDQTTVEKAQGNYYLRATSENSPVSVYGKPELIGKFFGQWLSNTINAMKANNCSTITMEISWK